MKIKLDECLDARLAEILKRAGHEVNTVREQKLLGISDEGLYERCIAEGYVLVTLDKDFSNVLRYPPEPTPGIVVLRGPNDLFPTMRMLMETFASALVYPQYRLRGRLWIVEPGRLRIHESGELWAETGHL